MSTVSNNQGVKVQHCDIETLVGSDGWKELRYTTATARFLTWYSSHSIINPVSQPAGWNTALENRDGKSSGASVTMELSAKPNPKDQEQQWTSRERAIQRALEMVAIKLTIGEKYRLRQDVAQPRCTCRTAASSQQISRTSCD